MIFTFYRQDELFSRHGARGGLTRRALPCLGPRLLNIGRERLHEPLDARQDLLHDFGPFGRDVVAFVQVRFQVVEFRRCERQVTGRRPAPAVGHASCSGPGAASSAPARALQVHVVEVEQRLALELGFCPESSGQMSMPSSGFAGGGAPHSFATVGRMSMVEATPSHTLPLRNAARASAPGTARARRLRRSCPCARAAARDCPGTTARCRSRTSPACCCPARAS